MERGGGAAAAAAAKTAAAEAEAATAATAAAAAATTTTTTTTSRTAGTHRIQPMPAPARPGWSGERGQAHTGQGGEEDAVARALRRRSMKGQGHEKQSKLCLQILNLDGAPTRTDSDTRIHK